MFAGKSDKELAFLYDLYVAVDWNERFAGLLDEHVELPKQGRILYVAAGTGGHALALLERAGKEVTLVSMDESEERLILARAKAKAMKLNEQAEFRCSQLEALDFKDDKFDLVIGDASLVAPERLPLMLAEMVRVARPSATVALNLATASSFGEFFSIYWEALANTGLAEHTPAVETLIRELPTISDAEALAARSGLKKIDSWTTKEEFVYTSEAQFTEAPLVTEFLFKHWFNELPFEARTEVTSEIARLIAEERGGGEWTLSIKATLVRGRKAV